MYFFLLYLSLLLPFSSPSTPPNPLSPLSRFLLTLPKSFPTPGPFDNHVSNDDILTMNKKLKKGEGGLGGIVNDVVRKGGRGGR